MNTHTLLSGLLSVGIILLCGGIPYAFAEESASFRLYHEAPNYSQRGPMTSDSYQTNEGGTTYLAAPIASSSFQIVQAPPAVVTEEEEEAEETEEEKVPEEQPPVGHERGEGTVLAHLLAELEQRRREGETIVRVDEDVDREAAPREPVEQPFPDVDFRIPSPKPVYDVAVRYPRGEALLGMLHYFYMVDEERPARAPLPHYGLSRDVFVILERMFLFQHRLLLVQGVAALAFLLAFQLLLFRLPRSAYAPVRTGRFRLWFLLLPIIGKRRKEKEEEEKKNNKKKKQRSITKKKKPIHSFTRRKV